MTWLLKPQPLLSPMTKKLVKKAFHHVVYYTLVGGRKLVGKSRRVVWKASVWQVLQSLLNMRWAYATGAAW